MCMPRPTLRVQHPRVAVAKRLRRPAEPTRRLITPGVKVGEITPASL